MIEVTTFVIPLISFGALGRQLETLAKFPALLGILAGIGVLLLDALMLMIVVKAFRRRGVATHLVGAALEYAQTAGARQTYLEVRASNEGGITFYNRMRFRVCGRRPNYYRNPAEDAVLLVLHKNETNP